MVLLTACLPFLTACLMFVCLFDCLSACLLLIVATKTLLNDP